MKFTSSIFLVAAGILALSASPTTANLRDGKSQELDRKLGHGSKSGSRSGSGGSSLGIPGKEEDICLGCEELLPDAKRMKWYLGGDLDSKLLLVIYLSEIIAEAIYSSDVLSCVLMSLAKTARDAICFIADIFGVPNPDVTGGNIYWGDSGGRKLTEELAICDQGNEIACLFGNDNKQATIPKVMKLLGVEDLSDPMTQAMAKLTPEQQAEVKQKMGGDVDFSEDIIDKLFAEFVPEEVEKFFRGKLFFHKCIDDLGPFVCIIIHALLKTMDAITCKYREAGCDSHCTPALKNKIEYEARRLAIDLPKIGTELAEIPPLEDGSNYLLADIAAPCGTCMLKKEICSGYCNYFDRFAECDPAKRAWIAFSTYDIFTRDPFQS